MTTQAFSTRVRHDSDATFREWGLEFSNMLAALGLVQTADTGQINWTTVTRPGANTDAGYEVWRFNDTQQSAAPIYLKFYYGTHSSTTAPRIRVGMGTGSNGSGTLTNPITERTPPSSVSHTDDLAYQTNACHVEGFLGIEWKIGTNTNFQLFIIRTHDTSGAPDAEAVYCLDAAAASGAFSGQAIWHLPSIVVKAALASSTALGAWCLPQQLTSSAVGSDTQAFVCNLASPQVRPNPCIAGVIKTEYTSGTTLSATLVGTTTRTYIVGKDIVFAYEGNNTLNSTKPIWLFE